MKHWIEQLPSIIPARIEGSIARTTGATAAVVDFPVPVGAQVEIESQLGTAVPAEVIGFDNETTLLYPLRAMTGVRRGNRVRLRRSAPWLEVGPQLLGRIVDAHGKTIDGGPPPVLVDRVPRDGPAPDPVSRPPVDTPFSTGIRAIDALLTCGKGQRMGIFSGAGVGKSSTLGMMARNCSADVNVIALLGERGREVNAFIQQELGPEGLAKSVVVVATSDQPAPVRLHAAFTATAIAEYFCRQRSDVLLLMDSITRLAMAQREIGLAAGEPPTTRGYPPSVFSLLPRLVERTGQTVAGTITAFYSVLVEGDDPQEPISDTMRGLLDGHTWLSRELAAAGHYPAIDVLQSISRLAPTLMTPEQQQAATRFRNLLAAYREHADLISIGAYRRGSHPLVDEAIAMRDAMNHFLKQSQQTESSLPAARNDLLALMASSLHSLDGSSM